jgi:hypothetical protein
MWAVLLIRRRLLHVVDDSYPNLGPGGLELQTELFFQGGQEIGRLGIKLSVCSGG